MDTRHERRKHQTRQKLLDAALQIISTSDYDKIGVLDITEAADVSKGTFYQHFRDKDELTQTLIVKGFEALRDRLKAALPAQKDPERVREALHVVYQYASEQRKLFRLMLGQQTPPALNLLAFDYFAEVIEEIMNRDPSIFHLVPPYTPEIIAQFAAGACVRLGLWWLNQDEMLTSDDMAEITFTLLLKGIDFEGES
ncbi:MAG: TetR/AcrR family transcriptional regulator [Anaerolineae bacterium]|nr:TetR/AcrR family transcriptional regulator [Anaerolineae bacterium]